MKVVHVEYSWSVIGQTWSCDIIAQGVRKTNSFQYREAATWQRARTFVWIFIYHAKICENFRDSPTNTVILTLLVYNNSNTCSGKPDSALLLAELFRSYFLIYNPALLSPYANWYEQEWHLLSNKRKKILLLRLWQTLQESFDINHSIADVLVKSHNGKKKRGLPIYCSLK